MIVSWILTFLVAYILLYWLCTTTDEKKQRKGDFFKSRLNITTFRVLSV